MGAGASPPQLTLDGLSATAFAEYVGGSGTTQLLFEYTVRLPRRDSEGGKSSKYVGTVGPLVLHCSLYTALSDWNH